MGRLLACTLLALLINTMVPRGVSKPNCEICKTRHEDFCTTWCPSGVYKRQEPMNYDFGAFVNKLIKRNHVDSDTCSLVDLYSLVPPQCQDKLDWLVAKAEEAVLSRAELQAD